MSERRVKKSFLRKLWPLFDCAISRDAVASGEQGDVITLKGKAATVAFQPSQELE